MNSSSSAARLAAVVRSRPYMRPAKLRNSAPVRRPNNAIPSGTTPICRLTFTGSVLRSMPRISIRPELGAKRPVSILMVVDLPAPLGPRKPKNCPGETRRSTPSTATRSPKRRVRPWVEMVGGASMKALNLAQRKIRCSLKHRKIEKQELETGRPLVHNAEVPFQRDPRARQCALIKEAADQSDSVRHAAWGRERRQGMVG